MHYPRRPISQKKMEYQIKQQTLPSFFYNWHGYIKFLSTSLLKKIQFTVAENKGKS
jgi:hypothetical protein